VKCTSTCNNKTLGVSMDFHKTWEVPLHQHVLHEGMPPKCFKHASANDNKTQERLERKAE
jgi:hypothetical protein